jgi:AAA+ ATPase superfamily predicted ATPase
MASKVKKFFSKVGNVVSNKANWFGSLLKKKNVKIKKGLVILGMQNSGKTTIYDCLRGEKKAGVSTNIEEYDEFIYKLDKGREIHIREGKDLGGDDGIFGKYHKKMISDEHIDFCYFVFNIREYLDTATYQRSVNARLHAIHQKGVLSKNIAVIGSYFDLLSKEEQSVVFDSLQKLTVGKGYKELVSREFLYLLDLTDKKQMKQMLIQTLTK